MFASEKVLPKVSPFDRDLFHFRQRVFTIGEQYSVTDVEGADLLFIERPAHLFRNLGAAATGIVFGILTLAIAFLLATRLPEPESRILFMPVLILGAGIGVIGGLVIVTLLGCKRHVTIYEDESRRTALLSITQNQRFTWLVATYTIMDTQGAALAHLRKNYLFDIFRKRWDVTAPDGSALFVAKEDSIVRAVLRRFVGPFFGLLRTNFIFVNSHGDTLGGFNRAITLVDRYVLDLRADEARTLDRRIAVALGVMLDTGERR